MSASPYPRRSTHMHLVALLLETASTAYPLSPLFLIGSGGIGFLPGVLPSTEPALTFYRLVPFYASRHAVVNNRFLFDYFCEARAFFLFPNHMKLLAHSPMGKIFGAPPVFFDSFFRSAAPDWGGPVSFSFSFGIGFRGFFFFFLS